VETIYNVLEVGRRTPCVAGAVMGQQRGVDRVQNGAMQTCMHTHTTTATVNKSSACMHGVRGVAEGATGGGAPAWVTSGDT